MKWYLKALRQYADFTGRARRKEFWMFTLVNGIIAFLIGVLTGMLNSPLLSWLYVLAILLPTWAVGARRLHDTGRSGWWQLISIIPSIGAIVLTVFWATDGERQPNAYGSDPKAVPGQATVFS